MKRTLLSPLYLFILALPLSAQINAGEVPTGWTVLQPAINLQSNIPFNVDSASFDVDCDGINDIRAILLQGAPEVDAPNSCALQLLTSGIDLCADSATYNWRPQYYDLGQALTCTGEFDWRNDSLNFLGEFGGFFVVGPEELYDKYVAYRKGGQVGWFKLSFDVTPDIIGSPLFLQIHEVLLPCITNGVNEVENMETLAIYPNPTKGDEIRIDAGMDIRRIDIVDVTGKLISTQNGTIRTIAAPEINGTYFIRAYHTNGSRSMARLVRN